MGQLRHYVLSQSADHDLEDIFDYTVQEFGMDQAVAYLSGLDELFYMLLDNPELGRLRPELKAGLRSIAKEAHVVFYSVNDDYIRVIRVLHGSRDMINFLGENE
ncbi:toxin ParE1/3/4 [Roseivirga pacifica]|jgi:toxin ParE1/3/4|uniref:Toxin n=1 Tax=Roseivirga pacifica TaxID=1267423 RepID=A0A1I0MSR4_9BACT|nr:type II toxin-antitoxin system RelE/ParE family toxin [Roseivirga pacifica]RKQ50639.1 toxin ParE1/3/4 [Roseivirga pacifica]SEV91236.1 toxin ParE1/3/4 [Roseivirga pacifica]